MLHCALSAEVANFAGDYYAILLDHDRSLAMEQRAAELDPLAPFNRWDLGWNYLGQGGWPRAIENASAARAMAPEAVDPFLILVLSYGQLHRFPEMHAAIAQARALKRMDKALALLLDAWAAIAEDRSDDGLAILVKLEPLAAAGEASSAMFNSSTSSRSIYSASPATR